MWTACLFWGVAGDPPSPSLRAPDIDNCAEAKCNWQCYLRRYADLAKAFGTDTKKAEEEAEAHYNEHGKREGRDCTCPSTRPLAGCPNGSTCVDGLNSYSCKCAVGFTGAHCDKCAARVARAACYVALGRTMTLLLAPPPACLIGVRHTVRVRPNTLAPSALRVMQAAIAAAMAFAAMKEAVIARRGGRAPTAARTRTTAQR